MQALAPVLDCAFVAVAWQHVVAGYCWLLLAIADYYWLMLLLLLMLMLKSY
jgi:hypothetical protein